MTAVLHQLSMLLRPHAECLVAQVDVRLLWPFWQTRVWEYTRLWLHPFAERCHLTGLRVHSLDEMRACILHLVYEHGIPESADGRHSRPAGKRVRVLERVEIPVERRVQISTVSQTLYGLAIRLQSLYCRSSHWMASAESES